MGVRFLSNPFEWMGIWCLAVCLGCRAPKSRFPDPAPFHDAQVSVAIPQDAGAITDCPCRQASAADIGRSTAAPREVRKLARSGVKPTSWNADENAAAAPKVVVAADQSGGESLPRPASSGTRRLTLDEAIDTALIQNPDAIIARAAGPVSSAARDVAVVYPWNPSVQVQIDPFTQDASGNTLLTKNQVSVTQTFEVRHQTRYRRRAANAGWNQQRAIIAQGELSAAVAGVRAFFDALYRKGLRDLARESANIKTRLAGVVDRRFAANLATPVERITAGVAARQAQRQAELAEADYQVALNALRVVLNLSPDEPIEPEGSLETMKWLPDSAVLGPAAGSDDSPCDPANPESSWVANRPDVIAARFAVSAASANLDLAKANRVPNIATGPSYESDESGTVFLGVIAQMDLPVVNTGHPWCGSAPRSCSSSRSHGGRRKRGPCSRHKPPSTGTASPTSCGPSSGRFAMRGARN